MIRDDISVIATTMTTALVAVEAAQAAVATVIPEEGAVAAPARDVGVAVLPLGVRFVVADEAAAVVAGTGSSMTMQGWRLGMTSVLTA